MKRLLFAIAILLLSGSAALAQELDGNWLREHYSKREVMIPMRDGISLFTSIYEPRAAREGGSPVIMTRTPYSLRPYGEDFAADLGSTFKYFALNGYIIVYQSVRGCFLSEGEFENVRPVVKDPADANDTYDTIEWLLCNTHSNGRVGVKGVSYPGFYATVAAFCSHPALKAVSPQAPVTDWFIGDDFHRNGVLMAADTYSFGSSFLPKRHALSTSGGKNRPEGTRIDTDFYSYFLSRGTEEELFRPWADSIAFWNGMKAHPTYDSWWKDRNPSLHFRKDMPPMLVVGGLYDAEDCYGALATYRAAEAAGVEAYFVEGPWYHGGYRRMDFSHMGDVWFGLNIGEYYLGNIEYPFFAYYLEGKGKRPAEVWLLPSSETEESAMKGKDCSGMWVTADSWDLPGNGLVRFSLDTAKTYISDPEHPVPYFEEADKQKSRDRNYMVGNQSFLEGRTDVASWYFGIQKDSLWMHGPVKVHLRLSQTCKEADYIVKLIDERPDGYRMLLRAGVMNTRFRKGFGKQCTVKPGREFNLDFVMDDISHILLPGHRMIVQVQSSWFPLLLCNPQTKETMTVLSGSAIEIGNKTSKR